MTFDARNSVSNQESIRGLLQSVADRLDARSGHAAEDAAAAIRPSDEKVFMLISDEPVTISQMARVLGISRQAAHSSIGRLVEMNLVVLEHAPGSRRDKVAAITPAGEKVRAAAYARRARIEAELEATLGGPRLAEFRKTLQDIVAGDAKP